MKNTSIYHESAFQYTFVQLIQKVISASFGMFWSRYDSCVLDIISRCLLFALNLEYLDTTVLKCNQIYYKFYISSTWIFILSQIPGFQTSQINSFDVLAWSLPLIYNFQNTVNILMGKYLDKFKCWKLNFNMKWTSSTLRIYVKCFNYKWVA